MALDNADPTIGTSATLISHTDADYDEGYTVEVTVPAGGVSVFVGPSTVTTSGPGKGREVAAGSSVVVALRSTEKAYAIAASSQAVHLFYVGV